MILGFTVKNYKTFKDETSMSFLASSYDKQTLEATHVMEIPRRNLRVLKTAVIYGPNASGKTKLFEAIAFMRNFVIHSSKESQQGQPIPIKPFSLSEQTEKEPSEFEIVFLYDDTIFRYGFEATEKRILSEWLFSKPHTKEVRIFYRDTIKKTLEAHTRLFKKGTLLQKEDMVRENALLLSVAAQFNDAICSSVLRWFTSELAVIAGYREEAYQGYSMMRINQEENHEKMMQLIRNADLSIMNIHSTELKAEDIPDTLPIEVRDRMVHEMNHEDVIYFKETITTHNRYGLEGRITGSVEFSLEDDESHGTQRFFYLSGHILDALETGSTLFIDEFDARMHPSLVKYLFSLFLSPEANTKGAQLIITTHNTTLLQEDILRKDQIWFIDKDRLEAAHLYSLSDFKSEEVRKGENYEKNYLKGKYGAIPYIQDNAPIYTEQCRERVNGIKRD